MKVVLSVKKSTSKLAPYTYNEEIANVITHGTGVLLSFIGLMLLVVSAMRTGDLWHLVSFSIFGTTLVVLYLASTLYHSIPHIRWKSIFQIIDHSVIYLLIAGTYTPFLLVSLRGKLGWTLFGVIWGLAMFGIVLNIFWMEAVRKASVALYLAMGWLVVLAFGRVMQSLSTPALIYLVAGGIFYTVGVIFYGWKKLPYNHAIWHLFVLAGSTCHFFAVMRI